MAVNKRQALLGRVRAEVAKNGKITAWALDAYVNSSMNGARISYSAFMQAAREGMAIWEKRNERSA